MAPAGSGIPVALGGGSHRRVDFDLIDQEQVDDAELLVGVMDDDGPPARGVREELAVRDMQGTAIGHVDDERAERSGLMHVAELFDRHEALADGGISSQSQSPG